MLAYYNDYHIENYDWFMRMDDDSVLQWDNLNEFLEWDNKNLLNLRRDRDIRNSLYDHNFIGLLVFQ